MRKTSVQEIHFGDEPKINEDFHLGAALNWYAMVEDSKKSKQYLITHLKKKNKKTAETISKIPDSYFYTTLGWVARLIDRGAKLEKSDIKWFNIKLKELIENTEQLVEEKENQEPVVRRSPEELMKKSLRETIIGELDAVVDDRDFKFDVYSFLKENEVASRTAGYIKDFFQPELDYVNLAISGDKSASEYYNQSKRELNKLAKVLQHIVDESNRYSANTKKARRKTKPKSKLKSFLYKSEDADLQVASINPNKLIGAKEAFLFDTRSRKLTYIVATDDLLDIKGTTFLNIDDEKTVTKRIAKSKCAEIVQKLVKSKVRASRNLVNNITTQNVRSPKRTTNNFIIISAF